MSYQTVFKRYELKYLLNEEQKHKISKTMNDQFGGRGGMDASGTLEITGGYTVVCGPTQGNTATLDYDKSAVISGGTFPVVILSSPDIKKGNTYTISVGSSSGEFKASQKKTI